MQILERILEKISKTKSRPQEKFILYFLALMSFMLYTLTGLILAIQLDEIVRWLLTVV